MNGLTELYAVNLLKRDNYEPVVNKSIATNKYMALIETNDLIRERNISYYALLPTTLSHICSVVLLLGCGGCVV